MTIPSYCTEPSLFPSCIVWNENKFVGMCIKQNICPRFTDPTEFSKVNNELLAPVLQFQKEAKTTPKPPERLPFQIERFLQKFLERTPCPESQRFDFRKLPAKVLDCLPPEANALLATGLVTKNDVISDGELKELLISGKWDKLPKWLQFACFFKQLNRADMIESEKRIKQEMREEKFRKWGVRNEETIKSEFFTKKMKEMNKK